MARHIIWCPHFDRYNQSSIKRLLYGYSECHSLSVVSLKKEVVREQSCEAPCSSTTSVAHKKKTNPLTLKMHFAPFLFTIRLSHMSLNVLIKMTTYLCIWSAFALMLSLLRGWFFFLPFCRAAHIIKELKRKNKPLIIISILNFHADLVCGRKVRCRFKQNYLYLHAALEPHVALYLLCCGAMWLCKKKKNEYLIETYFILVLSFFSVGNRP